MPYLNIPHFSTFFLARITTNKPNKRKHNTLWEPGGLRELGIQCV
jgi:hypothetical protein